MDTSNLIGIAAAALFPHILVVCGLTAYLVGSGESVQNTISGDPPELLGTRAPARVDLQGPLLRAPTQP